MKSIFPAAAIVASLALVACGGIGDSPTPTAVIMVDNSGSTKPMTANFKEAVDAAIRQTASKEGNLWAASGDAAVLANSQWNVDRLEFKVRDEGEALKKADLQALAAKAIRSDDVQSLYERSGRQGSDLMGMLNMASGVLAANSSGPRSLLLLTDGGINELGTDLFKNPPKNAEAGQALISKFESNGLLQKGGLTGGKGDPVKVWLCGVGKGATGNGGLAALQVKNFWRQLIEYEGGTVVADAPSCSKLSGFAG